MIRMCLSLTVLGWSGVLACSQPQVSPEPLEQCAPRPGEVYGSTADSMLGGIPVASTGGIVDTERMIQPDPAMRTYDHMYALRYELRRFRSQHGRLPDSIEEFSPHHAPGIKINVDGWGSSIRYTVFSESEYEFRAPGPDHILCTPDDMVARNDRLPSVTG